MPSPTMGRGRAGSGVQAGSARIGARVDSPRLMLPDLVLGSQPPAQPHIVTHWGFPCCVRFPCVHAAATTPVSGPGVLDAHLTQPCQPSPEGSPGRPAHRPFRGLLGVHSRCGLHTRAVTVFRDPLSEGFRHFVTSMPAPVASGWSGRRVGLAPTGKRRLFTAHTQSGISAEVLDDAELVESECGAGGFRPNISVAAPFVWRCLTSSPVAPVSTPRSSNRTCRSPASGSRTRSHAFTHDGPRPSWVRRTSWKCPYRCESG